MSKHSKELGLSFVERKRQRRLFFKSQEFKDSIDIIKKHKRINEEDLHCNSKKCELNGEQFIEVCETVFENLNSSYDEKESVEYIEYDGIKFSMKVGHETAIWTEKV